MNSNAKIGFSLVELSIVLVILGLLVGGVLSGQSLIRAAEIRGIVTDHSKIFTAVNTFKIKYNAIPGDMSNATAFWGQAAVGAACATTVGTGTKTCDGNGNGRVDGWANSIEDLRVWQHLANAGVLEGSYTGTAGSPNYYVPNVNSPPARLPGTVWAAWYGNSGPQAASGAGGYFWEPEGNDLGFWTPTGAGSGGDSITAEEAWNIDKKMDDGVPATGRAIGLKGDATHQCTSISGTTTTLAQDLAATYKFGSTSRDCEIDFVQQL